MNKIYGGLLTASFVIVALVGVFFCGYYYGGKSVEPGIITQEKIVTRTVYRDYPVMSRQDCIDKLMCYDTGLPKLDIKVIENNSYHLSAGLCEREWSRDVKIELARSGEWRFYVAGGFAVGLIGAYLLLK